MTGFASGVPVRSALPEGAKGASLTVPYHTRDAPLVALIDEIVNRAVQYARTGSSTVIQDESRCMR